MKCDVHGIEGCEARCCAIWRENKDLRALIAQALPLLAGKYSPDNPVVMETERVGG